jgi:hypothetical protein
MNSRRRPCESPKVNAARARICLMSDRVVRSSKRTEHRDLQELQSRHEGSQRAHLPQEAKMAVPEVQEGPNARAQAALAEVRSSSPMSEGDGRAKSTRRRQEQDRKAPTEERAIAYEIETTLADRHCL